MIFDVENKRKGHDLRKNKFSYGENFQSSLHISSCGKRKGKDVRGNLSDMREESRVAFQRVTERISYFIEVVLRGEKCDRGGSGWQGRRGINIGKINIEEEGSPWGVGRGF